MDPLSPLRRTDKHCLAAGDGVLFDPPHPLRLERPGFRDGGRVYLDHAMRTDFYLADWGGGAARPVRAHALLRPRRVAVDVNGVRRADGPVGEPLEVPR